MYSDINFIGLYYSRKALWLEYELLWEFFRAITGYFKKKSKALKH